MNHGTASPQPTESSTLAKAPASPQAFPHRPSRSAWRYIPDWWPLLVILVIQAVFSLRLVRADTAFQDEALYLWGGHQEWAHWLHGASVPPFPTYFSGAPVIYPPLAALADSIGGLTAARILSLIFMLGATVLLWDSTRRLFGRQAAFFAAALFAVIGPTLHLGSFATYDSMSMFLIALSAWFVIRAGDRGDATGWMVAAGVAAALSNAVSYSSTLFDPVLVLLALLTAFPSPGGKTAARRCLTFLAVVAVLLIAGMLIGGSSYIHGIDLTTLTRAPGSSPAWTVVGDALSWTGLVALLALCGVIFSLVRRGERAQTWLLAVFVAATLLVPLEQANLHTTASLNKHGDVGAWFAAIAAGYAIDQFILAARTARARTFTCAACTVALAFPLTVGASQSMAFATAWPNSTAFVAIFGQQLAHDNGRLLVEDPSIAEYYLPAGREWMRWSSTRNIVLPTGRSTGGPSKVAGVVGPGNAGTFTTYIDAGSGGYFSLVALNFQDTTSLDRILAADLHRNHHYRIVQVVPYGTEIPPIGLGTYVIWKYEPSK